MRLGANVQPSRRIVVTGTSGTGKTSIINELRRRGLSCFDEPGRRVLTDGSQEAKSEPQPFIDEMLDISLEDYNAASFNGPSFFDRGLPDIVAYAQRFQVDPQPVIDAAIDHRYEPIVFVAPPWKEIFVQDEVRRASFETYLGFHELLLKTYRKHGYSIHELPKVSVADRVEIIISRAGA